MLRVEIDQSVITAPAFPRNADWWRDFLPLWFAERAWWRKPKADWDFTGIAVDGATGAVTIEADDARHGRNMVTYLSRSPLGTRFMAAPETGIRLLAIPDA